MSELRVTNTLTGRIEPFVPIEAGVVRIYVCGMTTYDYCHIGHARAMVTFDVVVRWLRERGFRVEFVRNHTDVDDKIIARAQQTGEDALALSARFVAALEEDLDRLGLVRPDHAPKVSEHMAEIVALVGRLVDGGFAYVAGGDVYFSVEKSPTYGELSGRVLEDLRAGERIAVDERKRHPGDFALWKAARPGEPAWESPWGHGRPGWHIECSAMSQKYLGERFDIHGGGIDLVFPHHENEIAQSECGTGVRPFARYWLHNGMLTLDSEKMSKSVGNIVRIRDLLDRVPAEALRLLYLEGHYRSPLPYSDVRLSDCQAALDRLYVARETLEAMGARTGGPAADKLAGGEREGGRSPPLAKLAAELGEPARDLLDQASTFRARFGEAMDEDFNTARAIAALHDLARAANRFANDASARKRGGALARVALPAWELAGRVLGIGGRPAARWFEESSRLRLRESGHTEEEVRQRIAAREAARAAKDWALADTLRAELLAMGVVIMDGPGGTTWRVAAPGAAPSE